MKGRFSSIYGTNRGYGAVTASEAGLMAVFLPESVSREEMVNRMARHCRPCGENPLTIAAASLLSRYFAGERVVFHLPVDMEEFTPFQREAYRVVAAIPYGEVRTYGEIAREIGVPQGARGVGAAMARNPVPIIIPCHRVVGASGKMTGYSAAGGVETKKWLLVMEGLRLGRRGNAVISKN